MPQNATMNIAGMDRDEAAPAKYLKQPPTNVFGAHRTQLAVAEVEGDEGGTADDHGGQR